MAVELRADPGGAAASDIVVVRSEVEIPFRLDNDSSETAELTLVARPVRVSGGKPCTEGGGCTIGMYLLGSGRRAEAEPGRADVEQGCCGSLRKPKPISWRSDHIGWT
jgi:hypothetical protein